MGSGVRFQTNEERWFWMYQVIDLENFSSEGGVVGTRFKGRQ